jgi:hypothetical protein
MKEFYMYLFSFLLSISLLVFALTMIALGESKEIYLPWVTFLIGLWMPNRQSLQKELQRNNHSVKHAERRINDSQVAKRLRREQTLGKIAPSHRDLRNTIMVGNELGQYPVIDLDSPIHTVEEDQVIS